MRGPVATAGWFALALCAVGLGVWRMTQPEAPPMSPGQSMPIQPPPDIKKPVYRAVVKPSRVFSVRVERLQTPQLPVVAMDDAGDFLFLVNDGRREYRFVHQNQDEFVNSPAVNVQQCLLPTGRLIQLADEPIVPFMAPESFPFHEVAKQPTFFPDGTLAMARVIRIRYIRERMSKGSIPSKYEKYKDDFYSLRRELHTCTSTTPPDTTASGSRLRPNYPPIAQAGSSSGNVSTATGSLIPSTITYYNQVTSRQDIYSSEHMLVPLCVEGDDTIWVAEHTGFITSGSDQLLVFHGLSKAEIPLPSGYHNIHRLASANGVTAATCGIYNGAAPFRSFVRGSKGWRELPIPDGFDCSFVQQVLRNKMILGYITSWDGKKMQNVVWDGDSIAILNDSPAWPKRGERSLVTHANRRGDIAVRNITNSVSGSSEYYLLSLKL